MDRPIHPFALILLALSGVAYAEPLLVAGERGIVELDDDGNVLRTIGKRAARDARRDRARILYLTARELRAVTLDGASDVVVAKLPRAVTVCASDGQPAQRVRLDSLRVQAQDDFTVVGDVACFSLKDRNENEVSVDLHVQVELTTGVVKTGLSTPECKGQSSPCEPAVLGSVGSAAPTPPPAAPFDVVDGHLVHDGKRVLALGDFAARDYSASGQWALLSGHEQDGDYIHFDALLLDRRDGSLYAIGEGPARPSKRLRKLSARERRLVKDGKVSTADLVGEMQIFWRGERLVFGPQLLVPDRLAIVDLPGDVIR